MFEQLQALPWCPCTRVRRPPTDGRPAAALACDGCAVHRPSGPAPSGAGVHACAGHPSHRPALAPAANGRTARTGLRRPLLCSAGWRYSACASQESMARGPTFEMSGSWRQAKPAGSRPLDGGVRRHGHRRSSSCLRFAANSSSVIAPESRSCLSLSICVSTSLPELTGEAGR